MFGTIILNAFRATAERRQADALQIHTLDVLLAAGRLETAVKAIDDTHGHPVGDDVLRAVAEELREVTRGGDLLGRFGGEEFAIIMPETDIDQAQLACERLRRAVATRILHYPNGTSGRVTISSGVAPLAGDEGCDHLVSRADGALYQAKAGGRNLVRLAA
ncbi:MAG: hypothetical protein QOD42_121 [Sphingomonadales bacterium]|jgi:diguanylate cyclase|nr:hypothetical protein [Sphingomonadales bacterium]